MLGVQGEVVCIYAWSTSGVQGEVVGTYAWRTRRGCRYLCLVYKGRLSVSMLGVQGDLMGRFSGRANLQCPVVQHNDPSLFKGHLHDISTEH